MSGRDFYVQWDTPTGSGGFATYDIFVLPVGTTVDTNIHTPVKSVGGFTSTGSFLLDGQATDSSGSLLPQTGTGQYVASVLVHKFNGLYSSTVSSSGTIITADAITYPTISSAAFTSNTSLTLTYNKTLT